MNNIRVSHKITIHVHIIIVLAWFIIQLAKSPVQVRETHYYQIELECRLRPFCEESACICKSRLSILRLPPVQRLARFGGLDRPPKRMNGWLDGWKYKDILGSFSLCRNKAISAVTLTWFEWQTI